jgi:hypothetical protein
MQKEGYTIFTGPLKHGPKGDKALRLAEKAGLEVEVLKKSDHANKHYQIEGRKMAQLINEEEDRKRTSLPTQNPPSRKTSGSPSRRPGTPRDGRRNSSRTSSASPKQT